MRNSTLFLCDVDSALAGAVAEQIEKRTGWALVTETDPCPDFILCGAADRLPFLRAACPESCLISFAAGGGGAADVVLTPPFRLGRVLDELEKRRQSQGTNRAVRIGDFVLKSRDKELVHTGTHAAMPVTDKEIEILRFLYAHKNEPVARDILLEQVWQYASGITTHTLETHIYRLRQKLEKDPNAPELLVTTPGGYCLRCPA